jgi:hypothetical protein
MLQRQNFNLKVRRCMTDTSEDVTDHVEIKIMRNCRFTRRNAAVAVPWRQLQVSNSMSARLQGIFA